MIVPTPVLPRVSARGSGCTSARSWPPQTMIGTYKTRDSVPSGDAFQEDNIHR
jgi:hypothetical protein